MLYNPEKFKAVFSYILSRCENKDKTVLCNLLYFSDFNVYELYEKPITNVTYLNRVLDFSEKFKGRLFLF